MGHGAYVHIDMDGQARPIPPSKLHGEHELPTLLEKMGAFANREATLTSIAISLRRIADRLDRCPTIEREARQVDAPEVEKWAGGESKIWPKLPRVSTRNLPREAEVHVVEINSLEDFNAFLAKYGIRTPPTSGEQGGGA